LGVAAFVGSGADRPSLNRSSASSAATFNNVGRAIGPGEATFDQAGQVSSTTGSPATTVPPTPGGATASRAPTGSEADTGSGGTAGPATAPGLDAKIIRTGSAELVVRKGTFDAAVTRLTTMAAGLGGFVSASETTSLDQTPRGTITLRVPARSFDRVVAALRRVGTVEASTTGSQDVTGEYTDVASRIRALGDEREQIRLVLGRAENIPDILAVRDRLSVVQGELEQLQGRQKVLDDQTSLSTLTVALREKGDQPEALTRPEVRSGLSRLWHDSTDRFGDGARSIALGLATMAPWLILALVLWLPLRVAWRRWSVVPEPPAPVAATGTD
jgi:hypothetical protein